MFEHILVPVDVSRRRNPALAVALALAPRHDARVTLLHVVQRVEHIPDAEMRSFYRRLIARAERIVDAAAARFARKGIEVSGEVCVGDPPREIVRFVESRRTDLIVIGSHPVAPGRPGYGLGTTSYKVAILCRCPILLVK